MSLVAADHWLSLPTDDPVQCELRNQVCLADALAALVLRAVTDPPKRSPTPPPLPSSALPLPMQLITAIINPLRECGHVAPADLAMWRRRLRFELTPPMEIAFLYNLDRHAYWYSQRVVDGVPQEPRYFEHEAAINAVCALSSCVACIRWHFSGSEGGGGRWKGKKRSGEGRGGHSSGAECAAACGGTKARRQRGKVEPCAALLTVRSDAAPFVTGVRKV